MKAYNKNKNDEEGNFIKEYLDFVLWHYTVIDGFWFLGVSEAVGQKKAEEIVEVVWKNAAKLAARDIKRRFSIDKKGLEGLCESLRLFPMAKMVGYEFEQKPNELILTVPKCSAQMARIRHGLNEFVCKPMHFALFNAFAQEIDPAINIECVFAPPDPHPKDLFCKWIFHMK